MMKKFNFPQDLVCFIPAVIFIILVSPYFGQAPSLDPMINYRHSAFFSSDPTAITQEGPVLHPPLLYFLNSLAFFVLGKQPLSTEIMGTIFYFSTSVVLYFLLKKLFNHRVALTTELLLFLNPLIIINYYYFLTFEVLILSLTVFSLAFYFNRSYGWFSFCLALLVLTKETAYSIVAAFFLLVIFDLLIFCRKLTNQDKLKRLLTFLPVILTAIVWLMYISSLGVSEWRDTTFVLGGSGSYETVIHNLLTLQIFNCFLKGNLTNAFWLNFQWVFLMLAIVLGIFNWKKIIHLIENKMQFLFLFFIISLGLIYMLLVLSFPTWTIPRYSIPILFPFYLILALEVSVLKKYIFDFLLVFLIILSLIANLTSIDPFSSNGEATIYYGSKLYNLPFWNGGLDRLMYNLQFLQAVKNQNTIIKTAISYNADIILANCHELKLGEKLWSIYLHRDFYPEFNSQKKIECINISEGEKLNKFQGKIIYMPAKDFSFAPQGNL